MTEARRPATAECLSCGREFVPRKLGHVFCSSFCRHRHRGEGNDGRPGRPAVDPEQIERLFDSARDPQERVRPDDWHPSPDSGFPALDGWDTVAKRRRWYLTLIKEGLL
jgi:hypothetical protein